MEQSSMKTIYLNEEIQASPRSPYPRQGKAQRTGDDMSVQTVNHQLSRLETADDDDT